LVIFANKYGYKINTIIDQQNRIITITLIGDKGRKIVFKNSYRLFFVSLAIAMVRVM